MTVLKLNFGYLIKDRANNAASELFCEIISQDGPFHDFGREEVFQKRLVNREIVHCFHLFNRVQQALLLGSNVSKDGENSGGSERLSELKKIIKSSRKLGSYMILLVFNELRFGQMDEMSRNIEILLVAHADLDHKLVVLDL